MVNDSTTPPHAGSGRQAPYGGPQTGLSGRGTRFFDWLRSLGVTRTDGWVGGVCAGIAYRIGIDPLIVRGIVVVAALLGAPAVLLYALAWALLPDRDGRIHLQRLFEGEFEAPMVAIGVLVLLALLPWSNGSWWLGGPSGWWDAVGRVLWTLIVLAAVTAVIVVAVRNADRTSWKGSPASGGHAAAGPHTASASGSPAASGAATGDASGAAPGDASVAASRDASVAPPSPTTLASVPAVATVAEPTAPPVPGAGASQQEVADWRDRQAQWKAEHDQWKQRLAEDMRAVKAQRSAQLRAEAAAASADAAARRAAYRAANPRVPAAAGWLAIGLALVAAAVAGALWGTVTGLPGYALTASLAAATLVLGAIVLVAGIARRRSGFLIFLGILLAVITCVAALLSNSAIRLHAEISGGSAATTVAAHTLSDLPAPGLMTIGAKN